MTTTADDPSYLLPLEKQLLVLLVDGSESTLLLLEILNNSRARRIDSALKRGYAEVEIGPVLHTLEDRGLVTSLVKDIYREPTVSIPEYQDGREKVLWWSLTPQGRQLALQTLLANDTGVVLGS